MAYVNAYRSQMLHAFPFFDELHCEKPTQDLVHGSFRLAHHNGYQRTITRYIKRVTADALVSKRNYLHLN